MEVQTEVISETELAAKMVDNSSWDFETESTV